MRLAVPSISVTKEELRLTSITSCKQRRSHHILWKLSLREAWLHQFFLYLDLILIDERIIVFNV